MSLDDMQHSSTEVWPKGYTAEVNSTINPFSVVTNWIDEYLFGRGDNKIKKTVVVFLAGPHRESSLQWMRVYLDRSSIPYRLYRYYENDTSLDVLVRYNEGRSSGRLVLIYVLDSESIWFPQRLHANQLNHIASENDIHCKPFPSLINDVFSSKNKDD